MAQRMTPLEGALIVRKGQAAPASQYVEESAPEQRAPIPLSEVTPLTEGPPPVLGRRRAGTIAITVRLDPDRYQRLKSSGLVQGLTNQEIMVAALDAWFRAEKRV